MRIRDAAIATAGHGYPVFPCRSKIPLTEHGCKDATTDARIVREWWARWPSANLAVATGVGLVVLDVDGEQGFASLAELTGRHGPLKTSSVITGGDGLHLWFKTTARIGNSAGRVGPGLDVRGEGGYVIAPPSIHECGKPYVWGSRLPLAPMPPWLVNLAEKPPAQLRKFATPVDADGATSYGAAALRAEADRVARTAEGSRNHALNVAAFSLGQLAAGGELPEGLVVDTLTRAGLAAGLGQIETAKTIQSGVSAGMAQPRSARVA